MSDILFKLDEIEYKIRNQYILKSFKTTIKKGQHLLILGPSGSGKTTLINIIAGLLRPSSGEIYFEKNSYSSMTDSEIDNLRVENFGFIFQKLYLIGHLNVEQNITIANTKFGIDKTQKLIKNLGLYEKKTEKIRNLSHGEAQRVAIARGVINDPKVIFADEPTSAVDDRNTKKIMDSIFLQVEETNSTLIVCTHDERVKNRFVNVLEMK